VIGTVFFLFLLICVSPLRDWCAHKTADKTGIERLRSFSGKPSVEKYLETKLQVAIIAPLRARGAQISSEKISNAEATRT
jgi:hypothetical protein